MANSDFYEKLDLRYPEIAICIEKIDRTNPGTKKFIIPILTPNMDTEKEKKETIHQNNSFIDNENSINISNIEIKNYIMITLPKELCAYVGSNQSFYNVGDLNVSTKLRGSHNITGNGSVGPPESYSQLTATGNIYMEATGTEQTHTGVMHHTPIDIERYIPKGSKWIVVFIGGDIGKPQIIGRYTEPVFE